MKRKLICIALIICMMLTFTGCKDAIPDMSEEQMTLVTEYAAALLLKYDSGYESRLLDDERLAEEEEMQKRVEEEAARKEALEKEKEAKEQEKEASESGAGEGVETVSMDPAEFLGLDDVSISFNGIEYKDSYPDSGDDLFFAINASEGCRLALVRLKITNTGSADNSIDIFNKNAKFRISINGGDYKNTMVTLLDDDFGVYAGTLPPGASADTVLLLELKEAECVSPESVALYIKYNGDTIRTSIY